MGGTGWRPPSPPTLGQSGLGMGLGCSTAEVRRRRRGEEVGAWSLR